MPATARDRPTALAALLTRCITAAVAKAPSCASPLATVRFSDAHCPDAMGGFAGSHAEYIRVPSPTTARSASRMASTT